MSAIRPSQTPEARPPRMPPWAADDAGFQVIEAQHGIGALSADELLAAREVQMRMLPRRPPRLRTLEFGGCYSPAKGVGGDFYDFTELGAGRLGLALGDVSGKGISAALMMAALHATLRSEHIREGSDLVGVLRAVNRLFFESTAAHHYATLFLGEYDDESRVLRYANCGHVPPTVVRASGGCCTLPATATVLGLFETWNSEIGSIVLEPGDLLLVSSDGVTEAVGEEDEEFGEGRLVEAARRFAHLPVVAMVRALVATVREFGGRRAWDDLTLLAARSV